MTKTALVTGSAGFIGRHVVVELERRDYNVIAVDIKGSTPVHQRLDPRYDAADAREYARPHMHFSSWSYGSHYDLVVHCAAVIGGRAKMNGSPLEIAYNFGLDSDFIQFCAQTRPGRVVLFSSSAAYPAWRQSIQNIYEVCEYFDIEDEVDAVKHLWLSEDLIETDSQSTRTDRDRTPDMVYGWTKLMLEVQAKELAKLGVPTHVFRPFSGYGSDQDDGYPWPDIMKRVLAHEDLSKPFEVWSSPRQVRDWIHVDDFVAQVFACVDADERGPINVCTGVPTTFEQLVTTAFRASDCLTVPKIRQAKFKPVGSYYRVGNPTRINRIRPATITVEQGVRRTLEELTR